jgi:ComF family protein
LNPAPVTWRTWLNDFVGLFVPRLCPACDKALLTFEEVLCLECLTDLPRTRFHHDPQNKVEQLFWGRVRLEAASAFLQFSRSGKAQGMLHQLKYRQDRSVGIHLGRLMAEELRNVTRFHGVDAYLPVPLHHRKERRRGYNQSRVLAEGMADVWPKPILGQELMRVVRTPSQTRKGRLERWVNVKEAFQLPDPEALRGMHVLIIDDVVTTGATVEGCIKALERVPDLRVSLFTAACA